MAGLGRRRNKNPLLKNTVEKYKKPLYETRDEREREKGGRGEEEGRAGPAIEVNDNDGICFVAGYIHCC